MRTCLRGTKPFLFAWLVYVLVIEIIAITFWLPEGLPERMDFRAMYAGGILARTYPSDLYNLTRQKQVQDVFVSPAARVIPFTHLAHEAVLFIPFSLIPYRQAYLFVILFNALLIIPCFFVARDAFSRLILPWQPRPGLIFFIYLPVTTALAHGQDSILLLLLCCLVWSQLATARIFNAGCILAFALFKPHLALLLGFLLFVRYGWRFVAGFAVGAAAVGTACLSLVGRDGVESMVRLWQSAGLVSDQSPAAQAAVAAFPTTMPNLRGLFYVIAGQHLAPSVALVAIVILSLGFLGWATYAVHRSGEEEGFALSVFCALLLSYYVQAHDLAVLLLPIALVAARSHRFLSALIWTLFILPPFLLIVSPMRSPASRLYLLSLPMIATTIVITQLTRCHTEPMPELQNLPL
jgi:hypothetical protein